MVCKCVVWVCFSLHICEVSAAVYSVYEAEYDGDGQEGRGCWCGVPFVLCRPVSGSASDLCSAGCFVWGCSFLGVLAGRRGQGL